MTNKMNLSKILKSILAFFALACCCLGVIFATACSDDELKIVDYGIKNEEINVAQNSLVILETPLVLMDNGECATAIPNVETTDGEYTQVASGSFIAEKLSGYNINYVIFYQNEQIDVKTVKVNVKGSSMALSADYSEYIDTETPTTINAICPDGSTLSYKVLFEGEEIEVSEGKFIANEVGEYTVEITAVNGNDSGSFAYKTFARKPSMVGEVESFGEDWAKTRTKSGITNLAPYSQKVSAETTLKYGENAGEKLLDRFGQESSFLSLETSGTYSDLVGNTYLRMSLNLRNDLDYYKQLQAEGYEYVSVWVYLDSQYHHHNEMYGTDMQGSLFDVKSTETTPASWDKPNYNPVIQAGQWTELRLGLYQTALGRRANKITLITSYDYYKAGKDFLLINNGSDEPNDRYTEPSTMGVYISDISVVRKADSAIFDKTAQKQVSIADIVNPNGAIYLGNGFTYEAYCNGKLVSENNQIIMSNLSVGNSLVLVKVFKDGEFYENRQIETTVVDASVSFDKNATKQVSIADIVNPTGAIYIGNGFTYEAYCNGKLVSENNQIIMSNLSVGNSLVLVKVFKDGEFYENRQIEATVADTSVPVAFTSLDTDHITGAEYGDNRQSLTSVVTETVGGKSGTFIKVFVDGKTEPVLGEDGQPELNENGSQKLKVVGIIHPTLKVNPIVSKEFLQYYAGGYLVVDYYIDIEGYTTTDISTIHTKRYKDSTKTGSNITGSTAQTWHKAFIKVDELLAGWSYVDTDGTNIGYSTGFDTAGKPLDTCWAGVLMYFGNMGENTGNIYFGGFNLITSEIYESGVDFGDLTK